MECSLYQNIVTAQLNLNKLELDFIMGMQPYFDRTIRNMKIQIWVTLPPSGWGNFNLTVVTFKAIQINIGSLDGEILTPQLKLLWQFQTTWEIYLLYKPCFDPLA